MIPQPYATLVIVLVALGIIGGAVWIGWQVWRRR